MEDAALDPGTSGVLVLGLTGMGKSTLVRRSAAEVFPHPLPIWTDLSVSSTPLRLLASIAGPLSLSLDMEAASADPLAVWREHILPELAASEKSYLVIDNVGAVQSSRRGQAVDDLAVCMIEDLSRVPKKDNPGLIAIADRKPALCENQDVI